MKSLGKTDSEIAQLNLSENSQTKWDKEDELKWQQKKRELEEIIALLDKAYNEKLSMLSEEEKNQIAQRNEAFEARFMAAQRKANEMNDANPHLIKLMQK